MNLFPARKDFPLSSFTESEFDGWPPGGVPPPGRAPAEKGDDERFMAEAQRLAAKGLFTVHPNPVVGCVIVRDGRIVGQGWHEKAGEGHAEVIALGHAGKSAKGGTLYVTLEPCCHQGRTPPCTEAIIKAGIARVVIAAEDPNPLVNRAGISELRRKGVEVKTGVGASQVRKINRGFIKRMTAGLPWVTLKIAASLDGKTAMSDGESKWITSGSARHDSQKLRASASGILTGIGTVLRDDPSMDVRLAGINRQPARIILDTNLSIPRSAKIFQPQGRVIIFTCCEDSEIKDALARDNLEIIQCPTRHGVMDLNFVLTQLGRYEMNTLLLEAGPRLSGNMIRSGLVDEMIVYMAPDLLGGDSRGMFAIPGLNQLEDKIKLEYRDIVMVGRDMKLTLGMVKYEA